MRSYTAGLQGLGVKILSADEIISRIDTETGKEFCFYFS